MALMQIRAGLAASLRKGIKGAQISGYTNLSPTPPFFDIELGEGPGIDYYQSMGGGLMLYNMVVRACVAGSDKAQQQKLDSWVAPTSVKQFLEADPTLGGAAEAVKVTSVGSYKPFQLGNQNIVYLGVEWAVEVWASSE